MRSTVIRFVPARPTVRPRPRMLRLGTRRPAGSGAWRPASYAARDRHRPPGPAVPRGRARSRRAWRRSLRSCWPRRYLVPGVLAAGRRQPPGRAVARGGRRRWRRAAATLSPDAARRGLGSTSSAGRCAGCSETRSPIVAPSRASTSLGTGPTTCCRGRGRAAPVYWPCEALKVGFELVDADGVRFGTGRRPPAGRPGGHAGASEDADPREPPRLPSYARSPLLSGRQVARRDGRRAGPHHGHGERHRTVIWGGPERRSARRSDRRRAGSPTRGSPRSTSSAARHPGHRRADRADADP